MAVEVVRAGALEQARAALRALPLTEKDCVVQTGSRALPFSVNSEDLDLVLISDDEDTQGWVEQRRHPERQSEQRANGYVMAYVDHEGTEVDIELWPLDRVRSAIATLGTGIHGMAAVERDFTRVGGLEVKVGTDLFHALWYGRVVTGEHAFLALRSRVPWTTYFAWKRDTYMVNVRDAVKGVGKSIGERRLDEAYLKLCWAADSLADGLIFHYGHSINRWKWRLRFLDLIEPWVRDWYLDVRFETSAGDEPRLRQHREVLRTTWEKYAGSTPVIDR